MPELPDVEAYKRYIDKHALRKKIESVSVPKKRVVRGVSGKGLHEALQSHRFTSTRRHGKYLYIRSDDGTGMVWHFGMTGRPEYYADGREQPKQVCVDFQFANGAHLAYASQRLLGSIRVVDDFDAFIEEQKLGPDALEIGLAEWRDAAKSRTGAIKALLMNQEVVAGVGNEYADEILFQTRVHPSTPVKKLDDDTIKKIHQAMQRVLKVAVRHDADKSKFPASYLLRHRRKDDTCPHCGGDIEHTRVSGRTSYFCPECQEKT